MLKLGKNDIKTNMLIKVHELLELKKHMWMMGESLDLYSCIEKYQGKRSLDLCRLDLDCLLGTIETALSDFKEYALKENLNVWIENYNLENDE